MTIHRYDSEEVRDGGTIDIEGKDFANLNAWGFDGWYGKQHAGKITNQEFIFQKGRISTRHQGEFPFTNVKVGRTRYKPAEFLKRFESATFSSK